MLLDAFGSSVTTTLAMLDLVTRSLQTMVLGIPVWDEYIDFIKWSLNSLGSNLGSAGLAIIAFTIIVKTIILPLTIKSIRSSKAMQELAPRIKELQKKHGNDRQKASQETFALYQAHGVNPMSGCLPMLIQIPIFFGVYLGIQSLSKSDEGVWAQGFLWLPSLHEADPYKILPILAGLFQFVQSRMMRPAGQKVTDPQQQIMNQMMNFMPLMVIIFGWTFDSGPVLYWATQSIYSVIQQWFITGWGNLKEWFPWLPEMPEHRRLGYQAPRNLDDVVVVSGEPREQKGFSGWMQKRMADAQKNAEARQQAAREQRSAGKGGTTAAAAATAANDDEGTGDGDVVETPAPAATRRKSTSYQSRVDAATRFGAQKTAATTTGGNGRRPASNGARQRPRKKRAT